MVFTWLYASRRHESNRALDDACDGRATVPVDEEAAHVPGPAPLQDGPGPTRIRVSESWAEALQVASQLSPPHRTAALFCATWRALLTRDAR